MCTDVAQLETVCLIYVLTISSNRPPIENRLIYDLKARPKTLPMRNCLIDVLKAIHNTPLDGNCHIYDLQARPQKPQIGNYLIYVLKAQINSKHSKMNKEASRQS